MGAEAKDETRTIVIRMESPHAPAPDARVAGQLVMRSQKPLTPSTKVLDRGECRRALSPLKGASNRARSSRCSLVRFTGVSTTTFQ